MAKRIVLPNGLTFQGPVRYFLTLQAGVVEVNKKDFETNLEAAQSGKLLQTLRDATPADAEFFFCVATGLDEKELGLYKFHAKSYQAGVSDFVNCSVARVHERVFVLTLNGDNILQPPTLQVATCMRYVQGVVTAGKKTSEQFTKQ